jgi:hypothetical protein
MEAMGDKKGILKSIFRQLHQGARVEEVAEKAREVLHDLSAEDIAAVEQELVQEGIPRETIRKLCDLHLAVVKESLERKPLSPPQWHPLFILMEEHKILLSLAQKLTETDDPETVGHIMHHFRGSDKHYLREENVLFPFLEKHGVTEPPAVMWSEHDTIREMESTLYGLFERKKFNEIKQAAAPLHDFLSRHFYKENNVLFPTAHTVCDEREFFEMRRQFDEIGYCCFTPEPGKISDAEVPAVEDDARTSSENGVIQLETGSFTLRELEAMLDTLPVDITFVGADDTVRYFSQSPERVFVRTKAILGRTVQNCHPSKSVDIVNSIVDAFKKGTRNEAAFWLELNGRLVYIRYFPVRKNGEYLGIIEVTQDITDIKKIDGEKRLLEWK